MYLASSRIIAFLAFCFFITVASIAVQVLFAVAAYNDARSKMNPNALMWGLLIGFLGSIPGIIYLCVRNNTVRELVTCMKCGAIYCDTYMNCPRCGEVNPVSNMYLNPFALQQRNRAKRLCIAAVVIIGATVLIAILGFAWFIAGSNFGVFYN